MCVPFFLVILCPKDMLFGIFRLTKRTHNFIVSWLGHCIVTSLDRRLCQFVYSLLHSTNTDCCKIARYTIWVLHCQQSIISEHFKYYQHTMEYLPLIVFFNSKASWKKNIHHYSDEVMKLLILLLLYIEFVL